jgi:hypothetical protein
MTTITCYFNVGTDKAGHKVADSFENNSVLSLKGIVALETEWLSVQVEVD